jgi:hypothetical protein
MVQKLDYVVTDYDKKISIIMRSRTSKVENNMGLAAP